MLSEWLLLANVSVPKQALVSLELASSKAHLPASQRGPPANSWALLQIGLDPLLQTWSPADPSRLVCRRNRPRGLQQTLPSRRPPKALLLACYPRPASCLNRRVSSSPSYSLDPMITRLHMPPPNVNMPCLLLFWLVVIVLFHCRASSPAQYALPSPFVPPPHMR